MLINTTNIHFVQSKLQIGNVPKEIILHHADASGCDIHTIHQWHLNNEWAGCGYHYYVRKDGSIYEGRPTKYVGSHTAGHNTNTIGICAEGKYETTDITMPPAQKESLKWLVSYLKNKFGITSVKRHSDYNNTDCPGKYYPFEEIAGVAASNKVPIINNNANNGTSIISDCASYIGLKCRAWQLILIALGYSVGKYGADGKYGTDTYNATVRFQRANRLLVDGKPGPNTLRAAYNIIKDTLCGIAFTTPQETKIIQCLLGISIDGVFYNKTDAAVRAFQNSHGLSIDGIVGCNTWKVLFNEYFNVSL